MSVTTFSKDFSISTNIVGACFGGLTGCAVASSSRRMTLFSSVSVCRSRLLRKQQSLQETHVWFAWFSVPPVHGSGWRCLRYSNSESSLEGNLFGSSRPAPSVSQQLDDTELASEQLLPSAWVYSYAWFPQFHPAETLCIFCITSCGWFCQETFLDAGSVPSRWSLRRWSQLTSLRVCCVALCFSCGAATQLPSRCLSVLASCCDLNQNRKSAKRSDKAFRARSVVHETAGEGADLPLSTPSTEIAGSCCCERDFLNSSFTSVPL